MNADSKPILSSVKLFPRLAMTKRNTTKPVNRSVSRHRVSAAGTADSREARRTQVRARLLRMILDNEEVRRNDQRPNAS